MKSENSELVNSTGFALSLKNSNKKPRLENSSHSVIPAPEEYSQDNLSSFQSVRSIQDGKVISDYEDLPTKKVVPLPVHDAGTLSNGIETKSSLLEALQKAKDQQSTHDSQSLVLNHHADDINVSSAAYENVPVEDYGAALLRGMGWTGDVHLDTKSSYKEILPRKKGLGLGASVSGLQQSTRLSSDRKEKVSVDSIVRLVNTATRAVVVQTAGVPGLNRIRVKLEKSGEIVDIEKNSLALVSSVELEDRPFFYPAKEEENTTDPDDTYREVQKDQHWHSSNLSELSSIKTAAAHQLATNLKVVAGNKTVEAKKSWLQQGIRVKIVSKKVGGKELYLQKATVLDIPFMGMALVMCDDGQVIEVKEKYLETVLPKIGESCMVLRGNHKGESATFLSRDDTTGTASIEIHESFERIQVSFDDVAAIT